MSYNDQWQRDQRDRELGSIGIVTGSAINRQELDYRDSQQRNTQEISDNLFKQFQPKTTSPGRVKSPILLVTDGSASHIGAWRVSSASVFLSLIALTGIFFFLVTGNLTSTSIAAAIVGGILFGIRGVCRTRPAKMAGAFLAKVALTVFLVGYFLIRGILILSIPTIAVYLAWANGGQVAALWTAGGFFAVAIAFLGIHWLNLKYRRFAATPDGKKFSRNLGRFRLILTLGLLGTGLWWLWSA